MTAPGRLFLGVDGGGTSTDAWLGGPDGPPLGRGRSGPSNAKAVGPERARAALDEAIDAAFRNAGLERRPAEVACLGLAGFDRPDDRALLDGWRAASGWSERGLLVNDGDLVLAAGTPDGWGVGLISGTGSIAVGRGPDGRGARAGGWGYLIGDEGSAYDLALSALRLVARRHDGRSPRPAGDDRLAASLCAALGVPDPSRIVAALHAPGMDRTRIAGLAPAVLAAAEDDPEVADGLIGRAGEALAELVDAVAGALDLRARQPVPVGLAGGFLLGSDRLRVAWLGALDRRGLRVVATPVPDPALGALALARAAGR